MLARGFAKRLLRPRFRQASLDSGLRRALPSGLLVDLYFFGTQGLADMIFYAQTASARLRSEPNKFDFGQINNQPRFSHIANRESHPIMILGEARRAPLRFDTILV